MKLNVATHNVHKLREIGEILPEYDIVPDDPDVGHRRAPSRRMVDGG